MTDVVKMEVTISKKADFDEMSFKLDVRICKGKI